MKVYWIAMYKKIDNQENIQNYGAKVTEVFKSYNAKPIVRGGKFNPKLIPKMSDEEAIVYLSQLRQIGRWSAEMILLFTYNRPNIWPIQDIGLLRAISNNYKKNIYHLKVM